MRLVKTYEQWVNESMSFSDLYHNNNEWMRLYKSNMLDEIKEKLYVLTNKSYSLLLHHNEFKDDEIFNNEWKAMPKHIDSDEDSVIIYDKTDKGFEVIALGHNGLYNGKDVLIDKLTEVLEMPGYWMKASSYIADKLHENGTRYINDKSVVMKMYKDISWVGDIGYFYKNGNIKDKYVIFGDIL